MSILIKGMKKPDHCLRCKIFRTDEDRGDICPLMSDDEIYDSWEKMLEHCPLVEVPEPHGRLIDADELQTKHHWTDDYYGTEYVEMEDIDNAPTVIEAEGE